MRSQLIVHKDRQNIFVGYAILVIVSVFASIALETITFVALPLAFLVALQAIFDYEKLFFLLFACIPLSIEFSFSSSLATDLPTEPLIIGLAAVYLIHIISKPKDIDFAIIKHPITTILLLHLVWILITTLTSSSFGISLKFFLAKGWYIITFYFLTYHIVSSEKKIDLILWLIVIPLFFGSVKVFIHHFTLDFGFKEINAATHPFFRNHVNYAAILAIVTPFVWYLQKWAPRQIRGRSVARIIGLYFIIAIGFAYTRAAYIALLLAFAAYWVIRFRLIFWAMLVSSLLVLSVVTYLVTANKFMEYAPTEKTVSHTSFDGIMSSTTKLEDVSTMERYYRWIAGTRMIAQKPFVGFGPSTFREYYKPYALARFTTYVSDNPEGSGIHNYYLMTFVEQGLPGFIIFLLLAFFVLIYGQKIYHLTPIENKKRRDLIMAITLSLVVIDAFQIINDLVETDKVGAFFFFNIGVLVVLSKFNEQDQKQQEVVDVD
ncbi:MAG: O-antigen ligase family protein [Aureispira sp.]|nr:O-antigen ligase family protein [Aureispira sp.]